MNRTKKLALLAALAAVALTIFVAESQIPPVVPVPGVKLGLANIVTMVTMLVLGRKEAGAVLVVRLILGSAFAGGFSGLIFSAAGGAAAYLVMCLLIRVFPEKLVWVVSVLAALAHNAGQLAAAVWVSGTPGILVYAPALAAAGVVTGVFTGLGAMYLTRAIRKLGKWGQ